MSVPLNKTSNDIPEWILKSQLPNVNNPDISASISVKTEEDVIKVKAEIEKLDKNKKIYIDENINKEKMSEIKEYAEACGVDQRNIIKVSELEKKKTSSVKKEEVKDKDVFNSMKSFADEKSFEKNKNWEKISNAKKINSKGKSTGDVARVDGVERYEDQRNVKIKSGENSILSPDNIGNSLKAKTKDSQTIIKESNEKRKSEIVFDKAQWEKELKEKFSSAIVASKSVKLTESADPQGHQKLAEGQHSIFDKKDPVSSIPERTEGEKIADKNKDRKSSIQRNKDVDDRSWDALSSSKKPIVSDILYKELRKRIVK